MYHPPEIFVLKIVWRKSIASLHRLTQAVQRANLRRTAGDPTWVIDKIIHTNLYINFMALFMQINQISKYFEVWISPNFHICALKYP